MIIALPTFTTYNKAVTKIWGQPVSFCTVNELNVNDLRKDTYDNQTFRIM